MARSGSDRDRVTIQAVARQAGVSPMTVSNVFHGRGRVGEETRKRVRKVIDELGYVPSIAAQRLVGAATARVGLIHARVDAMFHQMAVSEIALAAAEQGLQLVVQEANKITPALMTDAVDALVRRGADSLILTPPFVEVLAADEMFQALDVPKTAIATAGPLPGIATVRIDNRAAVRELTCRLIAAGRRRIAFVAGHARHSDSQPRLEGYRDALEAAGLAFLPELVREGTFLTASGFEAAEDLLALSRPPDAIMAANDDMACGVLAAAHKAGLTVPQDLAVTGFDDSPLASRVVPQLTSVRQPLREMAMTAMDLLAKSMDGKAPFARDIVLDFSIVERESFHSYGSDPEQSP